MPATGHNFKFRLLIEGVKINFTAFRLSMSINQPASLTITLPAVESVYDLPDRSIVQLCYIDTVPAEERMELTKNLVWRQLFIGEYRRAFTFHKTASMRDISITAYDFSNHWFQTEMWFIDPMQFPKRATQLFHLIDPIAGDKMATVDGIPSGIIRYLEIAKSGGIAGMIPSILNDGRYYSFYRIKDDMYTINKKTGVIANTKTNGIYQNQSFIEVFNNRLRNLGGKTTLGNTLLNLISYAGYRFFPVATIDRDQTIKFKDETLRQSTHIIFAPEMWSAPPPRCNVIFPVHIASITANLDDTQRITRMEMQLDPLVRGSTGDLETNYYIFPAGIVHIGTGAVEPVLNPSETKSATEGYKEETEKRVETAIQKSNAELIQNPKSEEAKANTATEETGEIPPVNDTDPSQISRILSEETLSKAQQHRDNLAFLEALINGTIPALSKKEEEAILSDEDLGLTEKQKQTIEKHEKRTDPKPELTEEQKRKFIGEMSKITGGMPLLTPEEKQRGIVPYDYNMPAYLNLATGSEPGDRNQLIFSLMAREFFNQRYKNDTVEILCTFSPNYIIGFPALVLDETKPLVGDIIHLSHSFDFNTGGSTSVVLKNARPYDEFSNDNIEETIGIVAGYAEINGGVLNFPFTYDTGFYPGQIGREKYNKFIIMEHGSINGSSVLDTDDDGIFPGGLVGVVEYLFNQYINSSVPDIFAREYNLRVFQNGNVEGYLTSRNMNQEGELKDKFKGVSPIRVAKQIAKELGVKENVPKAFTFNLNG